MPRDLFEETGINSQSQPRDLFVENGIDFANSHASNSKISRGEAAFTTLTNPLGFGDELKAGIAAIGAKAFGGDVTKDIPISELYTEARDSEREKLKQAREQYPIQSVATGIISDLGVAGKALNVAKMTAPTIKNLAISGAAFGGINATGENEDIKSLPKDIFYGTTIGSGGNVVIGKALQGVQKAYPLIKNLINKNKNPEKEAVNILSKYIDPEDAQVIANKLITAEQNNRQTLLPDIASDEVQGLTRLLNKTEGSKNLIADVFNKRTLSSNRRVANAINNKISSEAYFGNLDELIKARSEVSKPLYEQAYKEGNKNLKKLLKPKITTEEKFVSDGFGGTKKEVIKTEIPSDPLFTNPNVKKYINKAKNDPLFVDPRISDNDFAVLDGAKKMIDDDIGVAMRAGEKERAGALIGIKKQIVNKLESVSPTYKQARQTFADQSSLIEAQKEGLDFTKYRPEELKEYFSDLTPGEKDAFKVGVRENLMKSVDKTNIGSSSAGKIFAKPENRNQLKIIFENQKEYSDFARRMTDEIRIFNTKQRILGGSRTDINLADEEQLINKIANGELKPTKTSIVKNVIDATTSSLEKKYKGLNKKNAKQLAEILTNRKRSIDALTKIIQTSEPSQQKIIKNALADIMPIIISSHGVGNIIGTKNIENNQNTEQ